MTERLEQQIAFLNEADKLKSVVRATTLCDASRFENSAEHSWHLTLYALVLADQAGPDVDITRVIKMLILHDLVEIDAGDAPIFGDHDVAAMQVDEQRAANRVFGLLPKDLGDDLRAVWEEFEASETASAKFAKSLDRFQPPMQNLQSGGGSWIAYDVSEQTIAQRVGAKIEIGAPALWRFAQGKIAAFFAARKEH
jgi:putative hydrolase of HD superfamily